MLSRFWHALRTPRLRWLQVEISSRCTAACIYCPRTLYGSIWQGRLMDIALFEKLAPVLRSTGLVHLQGWGEPLIHPEFFRFVAFARNCGCRVSSTSNGNLLDEELCRRIVREGPDTIGFSLAGVDRENDRIRSGTSLEKVLAAIDCLNRLKKQAGSGRPAIHIAYLLLRSQIDTVAHLPDLLARRGISQVVISTLDFIGGNSLAGEALPRSADEYLWLQGILAEVAARAEARGIAVHCWLPVPDSAKDGAATTDAVHGACTEGVLHAAFVSAGGDVSPCAYANMPLSSPATHFVDGAEQPVAPLRFGNLQEHDFAAIWRSPAYTAFRRTHRAGYPPPSCRRCRRMAMADRYPSP